jgi:hypothetical protein
MVLSMTSSISEFVSSWDAESKAVGTVDWSPRPGLEAMWLPPCASWKMNREPCEWMSWMIGFHASECACD